MVSKGIITGGLKNITSWLPLAAVIYAAWKYYSDRGVDGIMADIDAITYEGVKAKISSIGMGVALIVAGSVIPKYIPTPSIRPVAAALLYYLGASQLFGALRSGAAAGRGYIRSPQAIPAFRRR